MQSSSGVFPRFVFIEDGALSRVSDVLSSLDARNILIVSNQKVLDAGADRLFSHMGTATYKVHTVEVATEENVRAVGRLAAQERFSAIIGMGGGSAIDVGKLVAHRTQVPFISIPTAASHDGIASPIASIKEESGFRSYPARGPYAVVADVGIIRNAPASMLSAGVGDLVSNITAVEDWKLAHEKRAEPFDVEAAALSISCGLSVSGFAAGIKTRDAEAVTQLVRALVDSGLSMCMTGNSRPCSGAEHLFSHALDMISQRKALHGAQCGVGTILMAHLHGLDWQGIRSSLEAAGAPTSAKGLGIDEGRIIEALLMAPRIRDRFTILDVRRLDAAAAEELVKATDVV